MPPAVLHIPEPARRRWQRTLGSRYRRQVAFDSPFQWSATRPGACAVSPTRFCELTCDGIVSRLLCLTLDPPDRRLFAPWLEGRRARPLADDERWIKGDYRPAGELIREPRGHVAPCVALIRRSTSCGDSLAAIAVGDDVFDESDGRHFELALYFALQSAGIMTTLHAHPMLHFPHDSISAIAETIFPAGHTIGELLRPHRDMSLTVSAAVLHGPRSVLRPGHVYSPYPGSHRDNLAIVSTIWAGHPHADGTPNSAYPRYRFPRGGRPVHSPYGDFLRAYREVIRAFCDSVVAASGGADGTVRLFADHVSHWVPGFPSGEEVRDPAVLADALSVFIFEVSVAHSSDHVLYGRVDPREVPFRLRSEPPSRTRPCHFDRATLVKRFDTFQYAMCSRMYFQPHPLQRLAEVGYRFDDAALLAAADHFRTALREVEARRRQAGQRIYAPLELIAPSVQF